MMDLKIPETLVDKIENELYPKVNGLADKVNDSLLPKIENLADKADKTLEEDLKPTLAAIRKYLPLIAIPIFVSFAVSVASLVCVIILLFR